MIPCKDCLLIPVCRNKDYRRLLNDCSILNEILYKGGPRLHRASLRTKGFIEKISDVQRILHPLHWEIRLRDEYDWKEEEGVEIIHKLRVKKK